MHRDPVRIAILLLLALAAYGNSFHAAFQFDDYNVIVNNPNVHSLTAWWQHIVGIRPLLKLSYTLNWISGLGVSGFHAVNFIIHGSNAALVYLLLQRLPAADADTARNTAFVAALLFAVLPVQSEAVTYISGRSVSLMTLFYLAALLAYARGLEQHSSPLRTVVSPLLFLAALLVKEVAVTLPLALLLWEKAHGTPARLALRRAAPHWFLFAVAALLLLSLRDYAGLFAFSFSLRSSGDNLLTQIHAVTYLLTRLFALWGHNIDPDLPLFSQWEPLLLAEMLFLGGFLILGFRQLKFRPWLGFGILWLALHLLPTNSILPRLDIANERQLYLGSIGICLIAGNIFRRLASLHPARHHRLNGALAGWLLLLATATLARNHDYRNEIALWENTVRQSPAKARPWNNLGYAYALAGEPARALQAYQQAIHLKPDYDRARQNLAALKRMPVPVKAAP
ncbi:MAG: tetratricopeptide repeat protein [Sulfurimicrobium sp.]|jgi:tetratricopeptide (TPR) repeat protein|nr:tetratricopeptide repeat protein [Sulfurimicrobium sp.]MDZ7657178.1 tetratricopeptide repeat protein [Sulfurimicrobium sp.]